MVSLIEVHAIVKRTRLLRNVAVARGSTQHLDARGVAGWRKLAVYGNVSLLLSASDAVDVVSRHPHRGVISRVELARRGPRIGLASRHILLLQDSSGPDARCGLTHFLSVRREAALYMRAEYLLGQIAQVGFTGHEVEIVLP